MPRIFRSAEDIHAAVGQRLGESAWTQITQEQVNQFANATGDHQWLHVDPERAAQGPYGACIAHGYLTLALVNQFLPELVTVEGMKWGVNYGCDKVRFPAPVRVGARVRGVGELVRAETLQGGVQSVVRMTVEIEGGDKPACVAETISRYYF
ncbi:putative enoyl-CoA hydratase 1 [compost metagenome]|jgi:acyl dehydratase|uniref:Acyl dehydratase n=3 Tax=Cupriavidus necator TaxID=106590 RepID=Q0K3G0_CUPNH|nr:MULTISPECIES: MaoC family dehydratase [Cupriavidus]AEI79593.1 enoyl-CoA hydratase 1 [Cupriavidus necator N-1]EON16834.1 enoyl-CoA hydratase 1 [Cupriavidus sp. GA3-3]KAI3601974.1 Nodulation protein N-related dehydratase [Cupriavidus necator H850]KUE87456.1 dehydratase [Cupriavidus necator]MDX6010774.1 MaoC family dehydratase [Cupriavidus necator]